MYGLTIYLLTNEKSQQNYWIYGNALQIESDSEIPFKLRNIHSKGPYKLRSLLAVLKEESLHQLIDQLENQGKWHLSLEHPSQELVIHLPAWSVRPSIIAHEKKSQHHSAFSLTNNTANAKIYFALNKEKWLAEAFDTKEDFLERGSLVEEKLREESTLSLFSLDSERFGNFEIFTSPLQQSLFYPIGLHVDIHRTKVRIRESRRVETDARGVRVWADRSLEGHLPVQLNVTLWNGRGKSEAIVKDQLFNITRVGESIHCDAEEPISAVEVKLWNARGELLHYDKTGLIRQITVSMGVHTGTKVIMDPWSKKLPKKLRDKVEKHERISPQEIQVGDFLFDPWVEEAEKFSHFLAEIKPSQRNTEDESFFFPGNPEAEVRFFEFVKSKLDASATEEAIIADPFFDAKAASKLLTRTTTSAPLTILTSLTAKALEGSTSLLASLKMFLLNYQNHLPSGLTVINVQNDEATKQHFHDRFLLVKQKGHWRGWLLGNSYNSQAQRYPSVMVELPLHLTEDVHQYLNALKQGQVPDRPEALSMTLFSNAPAEKRDALLIGDLPYFHNWQLLMEPFKSSQGEEEPADTLKRLLDSGFFEKTKEQYSWSLQEGKLEEVRYLLFSHLETIKDDKKGQQWLLALSLWGYYGLDLEPAQVIPRTPFWAKALKEAVKTLQKTIEQTIQDQDIK